MLEHNETRERTNWNTDIQIPSDMAQDRSLKYNELYLLVLTGNDVGRRCAVHDSILCIGRDEDSEIQLNHPSISRAHARIESNPNGIQVIDQNSTNGTRVNGKTVTRRNLREGDVLQLGEISMRLGRGKEAETSSADDLYRLCTLDALTGAITKRHFEVVREREIFRALRVETPLTQIDLEITIEKGSNTTLEESMWAIGKSVLFHSRQEDILGKDDVNRFSLLLPHTDIFSATLALSRLETALAETSESNVLPLHIEGTIRDLIKERNAGYTQ